MSLRIFLLLSLLLPINTGIAADTSLDDRELRIGFDILALPDLARADIEVSLKFWTEEISRQANVPIKVQIYENAVDEMATDFKNGTTNFLLTTPLNFIELFDRSTLADGFMAAKGGLIFDNLVLLTHKNTGIKQFSELKGKRVAILKNVRFLKVYLQTLCLKAFHKNCDNTLSITEPERNSTRLILKLFFQQVDAVVANKSAFELVSEMNPQVSRELQIIEELDSVPMGLGFFNANVAPEFREEIIGKVQNITQYDRGKSVLEIFKTDNIVRSQLSDLNTVETIHRLYRQLDRGIH